MKKCSKVDVSSSGSLITYSVNSVNGGWHIFSKTDDRCINRPCGTRKDFWAGPRRIVKRPVCIALFTSVRKSQSRKLGLLT
jgi:hypothetical protein